MLPPKREEDDGMVKDLLKTMKALAGKRLELSLIDIRKYDSDFEKAMGKAVEFLSAHGPTYIHKPCLFCRG